MLLVQKLAFDGLHGVRDDLYHALPKAVEHLCRRLAFAGILGSKCLEQLLDGNDVSLFKLTIIFTVLLNGIIRQLHENLVFVWQRGVVSYILLRGGSHIRLIVHVNFAVGGVEQHPLTNVKLTFQIQHWLFNQFLDDESVIFHLLFICVLRPLVLSVIVIVVVRLKNGCFVSGAPPNAVVNRHDVSQLVERLENVDSNSAVQPRWLQHPKVLVIMAAICKLVWSFQSFLFLNLALVQPFVDAFHVLVNVFIYELHYA